MIENNITIEEIADLLNKNDNLLFICHIRPDGDTLAGAYALKRALEKKGKKIIVTSADRVSSRLSFLCDDILYLPDEIPADFTPRLVVSIDVASVTMLGDCYKLLSLATSIKIDHHNGNENFADYNYTEEDSASCSEIIYDIIKQFTDFDDRICELLYAGISFDTGCFKHSNVTAKTHEKAAYLISKGVDSASVNQKLFGNKTQKEIEALKMAYNNIEFLQGGKMAVICITNEMRKMHELSEDDIADLAQIPIEIEGVLVGAIIKEKGDSPNNFKISMRSRQGINAGEICKKLNGGGHICAAGGLVFAQSKEEAVKKVFDAALSKLN